MLLVLFIGDFTVVAAAHLSFKRGCKACNGTTSKLEQSIVKRFKETYPTFTCLTSYRPKWLQKKEIDIFIPELNLGLEVNGAAYHHSSLGISDFYDRTYKNETYHLDKFELCRKNSVSLWHHFEFEDIDLFFQQLDVFIKNPLTVNITFTNTLRVFKNLRLFGISGISVSDLC